MKPHQQSQKNIGGDTMTETFRCENCQDEFHVDELFYSETLDEDYCEDCGEQIECDAGADHMMSMMEDMD